MFHDQPLAISLFNLLRDDFGPELTPLRCTKATLVHLSHTLEDLVLRQKLPALLFTGFQESSHWREETERYRALSEIAQQVCIFAGGDLPPESAASQLHITLRGDDPLRQEWFLALLCPQFAVLLCGQDRLEPSDDEATRQFDTLWSFAPPVINRVLDLLEQVIQEYRPERLAKLQEARQQFPLTAPDPAIMTLFTSEMIRFEEDLHQRLTASTNALNTQLQWREDLLATLVHDMRTPLNSLVMALDMMDMTDLLDPESRAHMITVAKRSSLSLRDLVQLILDTNQLDEGQLRPQIQPFAPQKLLDNALAPLDQLIQANELTTSIEIDDRVTVMWGDELLMVRVVQNLVNNAIKFTAPGGRIELRVQLAPSGQFVELRVRDTGRGISLAMMPHIFDRYYQGRESDRRGAGLGLYFCKMVAGAHSGSIRVESQPGIGTAFTVSLPARPKLQ